MKNQILIAAFAASAAFGCASSAQTAVSPQRVSLACNQLGPDSQELVTSVLAPGATSAAAPIKEIRVRARASQEAELVGAQVRLPAPQNVSKEYLERVLTCHANTAVAAHEADPFHPSVGRVKAVDVESVGGTLAIQIRGNSKAANKDIWQRAQQLATPTTNVTVEQVSAAQGAARF